MLFYDFFMLSEHSLSIIWYLGVMPDDLILLKRVIYPRCISVYVLFFNGVTSMALVSTYTLTIIYLYPCWEL